MSTGNDRIGFAGLNRHHAAGHLGGRRVRSPAGLVSVAVLMALRWFQIGLCEAHQLRLFA